MLGVQPEALIPGIRRADELGHFGFEDVSANAIFDDGLDALIDKAPRQHHALDERLSRRACHRHKGIGAPETRRAGARVRS